MSVQPGDEFADTHPLPPPALPLAGAQGPAAMPPAIPSEPRPATIEFTGSGSEYFRIWIVNLLLILVTLSLYLPFARARRLRYFHANTLVHGHALGFHGDPWKMLRGHLLVIALFGSYALANRFSPSAGGIAVLVLAALWPALWHASMRFRLANTSWRGLRMRFTGSLGGAYLALLPALPVALVLAATAIAGQPGVEPSPALGVAVGLAFLAMLVLSPLALARTKRYQHSHYALAGETTAFTARIRSFYGLWLRTALVSLLPFAVMLVLIAAGMAVGMAGARGRAPSAAAIGMISVGVMLFYLLMFILMQPYFVSRLQNLVWGHTASPQVHFASALHLRRLSLLTLKNLVLMALTLGLYRPFAVVDTARLRLQSITVTLSGDVEQWIGAAPGGAHDAAGDAAGDLLGVDLGM